MRKQQYDGGGIFLFNYSIFFVSFATLTRLSCKLGISAISMETARLRGRAAGSDGSSGSPIMKCV